MVIVASAEEAEPQLPEHLESDADTETAVAEAEAPPRRSMLPQYRVLLHNDDVNDMVFVASTIMELIHLKRPEALERMFEAHREGLSQLVVTHREHAELLEDQFTSKGLTVTIEPE